MEKICKRTQETLIDVFYQEKPMDVEVDMHLKSCQECRNYWESLHDLKHGYSILNSEVPVDMQVIHQAFHIAEERKKQRKARIDFSLFLLLVFALMSIVIGIAASGYGSLVIYVQLSVAAVTTLVIPLLFIRKLRREDS